MLIENENIASWEGECLLPPIELGEPSGIATESQPVENPAWERCIDALLDVWSHPDRGIDPVPSRSAIEAAIAWLVFLRKRFPSVPPTRITPEPGGGIIVERRQTYADGRDAACELTFYNDGRAERTDYVNGRVRYMGSIPASPERTN